MAQQRNTKKTKKQGKTLRETYENLGSPFLVFFLRFCCPPKEALSKQGLTSGTRAQAQIQASSVQL